MYQINQKMIKQNSIIEQKILNIKIEKKIEISTAKT